MGCFEVSRSHEAQFASFLRRGDRSGACARAACLPGDGSKQAPFAVSCSSLASETCCLHFQQSCIYQCFEAPSSEPVWKKLGFNK